MNSVILFVALIILVSTSQATAPPNAGCSLWTGSAITSGFKFQAYNNGLAQWLTTSNLILGTVPFGVSFTSTATSAATFVLQGTVSGFSYGGVSGTQGAVYQSGKNLCSTYSGNAVTVDVGDGCDWNWVITSTGNTPPTVNFWFSQNDENYFGYQLGVAYINQNVMNINYPSNNSPNNAYTLYTCQ